ncbi:MAG: dipeptidase E [Bacteroidia bacterium]|jgi:dipeptidase E
MNILLLSNSTNFGEHYLDHAHELIGQFLGEVKTLLFIPFAGVTITDADYTAKVAKALSPHGINVINLAQAEDKLAAINNAEAIAVGGGNTFRLLEQLYEFNLIEPIKNKVNSGVPYIGWSAGSNIAGPSICTTNDMPIVEPPSFDALNLVPFQLNPHYTEARLPNHGGETRLDRLTEYVQLNRAKKVVCLPEGSCVYGDFKGLHYRGADAMKVVTFGSVTMYEAPATNFFN